jgi:hypothetical protein
VRGYRWHHNVTVCKCEACVKCVRAVAKNEVSPCGTYLYIAPGNGCDELQCRNNHTQCTYHDCQVLGLQKPRTISFFRRQKKERHRGLTRANIRHGRKSEVAFRYRSESRSNSHRLLTTCMCFLHYCSIFSRNRVMNHTQVNHGTLIQQHLQHLAIN